MIDGAVQRLPLDRAPVGREHVNGAAWIAGLQAAGWMPLVALLAGFISLVYLITTSSVATTGYNIQRLERDRDEWIARNEQLELELAKVHSLAWVEAQATSRLGMVKAEQPAYVSVPEYYAAEAPGRPAAQLGLSQPRPSAEHVAAAFRP